MKLFMFIVILLLSNFAYAEKNKSEIQQLPNYLKGIDSNGKLLRHGYILWLEKKPYTCGISFNNHIKFKDFTDEWFETEVKGRKSNQTQATIVAI